MQEAMKKANLKHHEDKKVRMFIVVFKRQISNYDNYDTVNGIVN